MVRNLQRISLYVKGVWGTWITPIVKKGRPHEKIIYPPGVWDPLGKAWGVFSIIRTKLVLANFYRGRGVIVVRRLYNVQNTVNRIGIWDPMLVWGVGGGWGLA